MSIIIFIPSLGTDNCNETNSNPFSFIMQFFCNIARYCRKISIFLFLVSILGFVGVFYFNRRNNYWLLIIQYRFLKVIVPLIRSKGIKKTKLVEADKETYAPSG